LTSESAKRPTRATMLAFGGYKWTSRFYEYTA
jgi:hypothetical protein